MKSIRIGMIFLHTIWWISYSGFITMIRNQPQEENYWKQEYLNK